MIMRILLVLSLVLVSFSMLAGELYGTITDGAKPISEGVKVQIVSTKAAYSTQTDKYGSYRIYVKEKGRCTLTVLYRSRSIPAEIFSYDRSLRYDWVLEVRDSTYILRRK